MKTQKDNIPSPNSEGQAVVTVIAPIAQGDRLSIARRKLPVAPPCAERQDAPKLGNH
jgi:hypothetical protein